MASIHGIFCGSGFGVGRGSGDCSFTVGMTSGLSMHRGMVNVSWGMVDKCVYVQVKGDLLC